jgi:RNA polymerase sigma-70 factor (ECF subfamily)
LKEPETARNPLDTTITLLERIRGGDEDARETLIARYLPALRRWAHGRLPRGARDILDTDDFVQLTLLRTLDHLDDFEPRWEGAFAAYLRRALLNQMRDEIRRAARRPEQEPLGDGRPASNPSPLEEAIGRDMMKRYEMALAELPKKKQEAVILRVELNFSHQEVADALGFNSANSARMHVARALVELSDKLHG